MGVLSRALVIVVALVNVGDAGLHVAIDQVEPLRIAGNVVVLVASVALLTIPPTRIPLVPLLAGAVSLALNVVFIATSGIGPLGAVLVGLTTVLLVATALSLRQPRT